MGGNFSLFRWNFTVSFRHSSFYTVVECFKPKWKRKRKEHRLSGNKMVDGKSQRIRTKCVISIFTRKLSRDDIAEFLKKNLENFRNSNRLMSKTSSETNTRGK